MHLGGGGGGTGRALVPLLEMASDGVGFTI